MPLLVVKPKLLLIKCIPFFHFSLQIATLQLADLFWLLLLIRAINFELWGYFLVLR